jgi:cell division protease FtsH
MPKVMPQVKQTLRNLREAIKRGDKDKPPLIPTRPLRLLLASLGVLVVLFVILLAYSYSSPSPGARLSLDATYRAAESGQVTEAKLLDEDAVVVGRLCLPAGAGTRPRPTPGSRCAGDVGSFHTSYPRSDVATQELIERLRSAGAKVEVDKQNRVAVAKLVSTFVFPLLLLANLFGLILMAKGGEGSMAEIAGFGSFAKKRKGQGQAEETLTFADVAGADEVVTELREVIDYLKSPERFEAVGALVPKGVLLFGPPGCGKTLTARAVAGEAGVPFFSTSGTEFVESLVGVGAARVRDLFRQVREVAPAICFIDEIDAVGRRRSGEGMSGGEREQTLNQLLVELDGFEVSAGIVVMGATNRPDILDQALMRPGRFDRHVTLAAPSIEGRKEILELHAKGRRMGSDVDFAALARRTPGFTGADLANVINEAALLTLRRGDSLPITSTELSEAIQRVMHGPQRRGHLLSGEERTRIALHESGHAIVATAMGQRAEVPRVSIVARGRGLASSSVSGDGDRALATTAELYAQLAVAMAGRAAEVLVLGMASTTAEDDIARATALAREMVGLYGLSEQLGPMRILSKEGGFLAGDGAVMDTVSALTMQTFDAEVRRLLAAATRTATQILTNYRAQLDTLAERVEMDETLEGAALQALLVEVEPSLELLDQAEPTPQGRQAPTKAPNGTKSPSATKKRQPAKKAAAGQSARPSQ